MQIAKPRCMQSPNLQIGFRPYTSPSLATVRHPMTIPNRREKPIRPIFHLGSQQKSNWAIKFSRDYGSFQSISHVCWFEQYYSSRGYSAVPYVHSVEYGVNQHLKLGSFSRKAKASRKNAAPMLVSVFIRQETFWKLPNPPTRSQASSIVTCSETNRSSMKECCIRSRPISSRSRFYFCSSSIRRGLFEPFISKISEFTNF